jgi:spore coat protein U-like protein
MKKLLKLATCLSAALAASMLPCAAAAGTATTTVAVTATVVAACTVDATTLDFGNYNGIAGAVADAVATISPVCTPGTEYSVGLDVGQGVGASTSSRFLTGPAGALLGYNIFTDVLRTSVWGDGTSGTSWTSGSGIGAAQPVVMYARIPARQMAATGIYADTVTVTLTY